MHATAKEIPTSTQGSLLRPADAALEALWLLTAILVPLWVNLWANQPFDLSKAALLRTLVWLMAAVWLTEAILYPRRGRRSMSDAYPLRIPVFLLLAALLLSTLFAVDPLLSLFGSYRRAYGALTLVSLPLLFLILSARLATAERARRLVLAMLAGSGAMVALGLLQAAGVEPFGMVTDAPSPVLATLGRPNFVGSYLALLLPLTLAMALGASERLERGAYALLFLGQLGVIALTLARGAWLAAIGGLVVYGFIRQWPRLALRRRLVVATVGLGALFVGLGVSGYALTAAQTGSIAARRTIWSAVWALIRERPWFGYGLDALELVFHRVYPPQLVYYHGRDVLVDRAHNLVLDTLVTQGIVGLVVWGVFLGGLIAYALSSAVRQGGKLEGRERSLLAACIAGVAANGLGNLVSFDVIATATATWLLMAVGVSLALRRRDAAPLISPGPVVLSLGRLGLVAVVWLVIGGAILQFNVRPLAADVSHRAALRASVHNSAAAVSAARRAARWWPLEPAHHLLLGRLHMQRALETGDADLLAEAEMALLMARDLRPQEPGVWVELGAFYHAAGAMWDAGAFPLAHQAYQQAVSLAPDHARLHLTWGQVYLTQDRPEEALARFYRAYDLDATDGLALRLIGDIELVLGRPEVAHAAYQEALRWSPDAALVYLGLARSHAALKQPEAAALALARAEELAPDHPAVQAVRQQWELAP